MPNKLTDAEIQKIIPLIENTKWHYRLDQFTNSQLEDINKSVQRARREISTKLATINPNSKFTKERLEALATELQDLTVATRSQITGKIENTVIKAGAKAYPKHAEIMSFGGLVPNFNNVALTAVQLKAIVNTPVGGKLLNEWVNTSFNATVLDTFKSQITTGMLKGESYRNLVKRFKTEAFSGFEKDIEGLTRTYVQSINTKAMSDTMQANADIMKGWKWNSVYENRTCIRCMSLDAKGEIYPINGGPQIPLHINCFLSKDIPIYTSKGWKAIGDIKIGDMVLTHKNRFRKVYATPRSKQEQPDVVRFEFKKIATAGLSITANHQVQVGKPGISITRWKAAKNCKPGDHIMMMANRCPRCKKLIPYTQKYCGHACSSLDITDRQWADPKHRENMSQKTSKQLKREYASGVRNRYKITKKANVRNKELVEKGEHIFQQEETIAKARIAANTPEINKACSRRMKKKNPMHDPEVVARVQEKLIVWREENPEKHPNVIMAQKGFMSGIERKMKQILDNSKVEYVSQLPIPRKGHGYYYVDFAIPSLKIAIEVDGNYWHQNTQKDIKRQKEIEKQGWTVIRFSEDRINNCLKEVSDEVIRVVCNHTGKYETVPYPVTSVELKKYKGTWDLFNLSVEDDESYIARGVVVHNCRCFPEPITKTFRELGVDIDEVKDSYRPYTIRGKIDPVTGKVIPGKIGVGGGRIIDTGRFLGSYEDFFKQLPENVQRQMLGPTRFGMYKSGKLKLSGLADANGRAFLIKELEAERVAAKKASKVVAESIDKVKKGLLTSDEIVASFKAKRIAYIDQMKDREKELKTISASDVTKIKKIKSEIARLKQESDVLFDAVVKEMKNPSASVVKTSEYAFTSAQKQAILFAEENGKLTDDFLEKMAKRTKHSKEDILKLSERLENEIPIYMNRKLQPGSASYKDLYENGAFKNQFELGKYATSGGANDPTVLGCRDRWETGITNKAFHNSKEYQSLKAGDFLPEKMAKERPLYAYRNDPVNDRISGSYGDVTFVLKDDVKKRATKTFGNSSTVDMLGPERILMAGKNNKIILEDIIKKARQDGTIAVDNLFTPGRQLKNFSPSRWDYVESQIYGGIRLDKDVAKIIIRKESGNEHIIELAKKWGLKVEIKL